MKRCVRHEERVALFEKSYRYKEEKQIVRLLFFCKYMWAACQWLRSIRDAIFFTKNIDSMSE